MRGTVATFLYATITVLVLSGTPSRAASEAPSEVLKLLAEIDNLKAETRKLNNEATSLWVTPFVTGGSILVALIVGGATAWIALKQTKATTQDRNRNARDEAILRNKNARDEATLKLAEFVMTSRQGAIARERLDILERIDPEAFGRNLRDRILPKDAQGKEAEFPASEKRETQLEVLRLLAAHSQNGGKIVEAFASVFKNEKDWLNPLRSLFP
jgi:hypothetical protein